MKKVKLVIILLYTFCNMLCFSQSRIFNHYTSDDGLPHDITYHINQDKRGYFLIGTNDGFTKFNGKDFINYTSKDGLINHYVIDAVEKGDSLLIGTWGGGLHIKTKDTIKPFNNDFVRKLKINDVKLLENNYVYANPNNHNFLIYNTLKKSTDWFLLTKDGLGKNISESHKRKLTRYNTKETVINKKLYLHANFEKQGYLKNTKGVFLFNPFNETLQNVFPVLSNRKIHGITINKDTVYASSNEKIYELVNNQIIGTYFTRLSNQRIMSLQKKGNSLYFVGYNTLNALRTLYSYNLTQQKLTNISKELGTQSFISDFMFDNANNLWVTTYGDGVYMLPNTQLTFYGKNSFANTDLKDLCIHNNTLFALATNKIYAIKNNKIKDSLELGFHTEHFQVINNILEVFELSTEKDYFKKIAGHTIKFTTPRSSYRYYKKYKNVEVFFRGNYIEFKKNNKVIKTLDCKLTDVTKVEFYKKFIYVLKQKRILYVYDYKGNLIKTYTKKENFTANIINDFIAVNNTLWIASDVGLFKIEDNQLKQFSKTEGLLSNHINTLTLDKCGKLWIGTQKGLNVLKNERIYAYSKQTGQKSTFITKIIENNDTIYVAGNKGLLVIDNNNVLLPQQNTKIYIRQDKHLFNINLLNFKNPNSVQLAYRLDDKQWITTKDVDLNFSNISNGKHKIIFKYKDALSNWQYTKPFFFRIIYPWHKQTWFYVLLTLALSFSITLLVLKFLRDSNNKNLALQKTLNEKEILRNELQKVHKNVARDFHDELGSKLANISVTSNLLLNENQEDVNVRQIQKDADYLFKGMRDFVWALDHKNNTAHEIQAYLNDFGEDLFLRSSIIFYSEHSLPDTKIVLPFYWGKQLVLLFKEAMTNALRHSKATSVFLNFSIEENTLIIKFKDNGIGFNPKNIKRINGIENMKARVDKINQTLEIVTTNGVEITFKGIIKDNI